MKLFGRRKTTTLMLLATIQIHGLEAEYVAARRIHRFRSTRQIASQVIQAAANDATLRNRAVVDLSQFESVRREGTDAARDGSS